MMENKVSKLTTKAEQELQTNLTQINFFIDFLEKGLIDKFLIIGFHKEDGLISYNSQPPNYSLFEYAGYLEAVKQYLIEKANFEG
jgi:hypothetical protein